MILPIYIYGQPVLRKVAEPIDKDYPGLDELIQNMKDTMYDSDGIGIAAPQVGVSARVVYIDVDALSDKFPELKDKRLVLINPEITVDETSPTETREEGCLSVPGIHENVTRHTKIHIHYFDENWQEHDEDIDTYLARVIQHECDHLEGHVFIDHISAIRKQMIRSRKQMIRSKLNNMLKGKVDCDYRVKVYKPSRKH